METTDGHSAAKPQPKYSPQRREGRREEGGFGLCPAMVEIVRKLRRIFLPRMTRIPRIKRRIIRGIRVIRGKASLVAAWLLCVLRASAVKLADQNLVGNERSLNIVTQILPARAVHLVHLAGECRSVRNSFLSVSILCSSVVSTAF
jgi:hypothetical protein